MAAIRDPKHADLPRRVPMVKVTVAEDDRLEEVQDLVNLAYRGYQATLKLD